MLLADSTPSRMPGVHLSNSGQVHYDGLPTMRGLGTWIADLVSNHGANAVYTTALITDHAQLVDWPEHEGRLVQGAKGMNTANPNAYTSLIHAIRLSETRLRDTLKQHAQAAMRAYLSTQDKVLPALMYILMRDVPSSQSQPEEQTTQGVPILLDSVVLPVPPLTGLRPDGGAYVLVAGQPRQLAHVKHTAWMQQRAALDALKTQAGAAEVLLPDESGETILEGLITNFAVITINANNPGAQPQMVLQAADTAVLPGLAMKRVLQAAELLGWQVCRHAPKIQDRGEWKAALICNSLRFVVRISEIACPGEDLDQPCKWNLTLPVEGHAHITALQNKVEQLQQDAAWGVDHSGWCPATIDCS